MIKVSVKLHNNEIKSIHTTGHSGSAEKGKDLVCAAVSAIMFGTANAVYELNTNGEAKQEENSITVSATDSSLDVQTILNTCLVQLETVQETNSDFIQIEKLEV